MASNNAIRSLFVLVGLKIKDEDFDKLDKRINQTKKGLLSLTVKMKAVQLGLSKSMLKIAQDNTKSTAILARSSAKIAELNAAAGHKVAAAEASTEEKREARREAAQTKAEASALAHKRKLELIEKGFQNKLLQDQIAEDKKLASESARADAKALQDLDEQQARREQASAKAAAAKDKEISKRLASIQKGLDKEQAIKEKARKKEEAKSSKEKEKRDKSDAKEAARLSEKTSKIKAASKAQRAALLRSVPQRALSNVLKLSVGLQRLRQKLQGATMEARQLGSTLVAGLAGGAAVASAAVLLNTRDIAQSTFKLQNNAATLGVSTQELQKFSFALGTVGLEEQEASNIVTKAVEFVQDAKKGGAGDGASILKQAGLKSTDFDGLDSIQITKKIFAGLKEKGFSDPELLAVSQKFGGDAARSIAQLIKTGNIDQLSQEAEDIGAPISPEDIKKINAFNSSMFRMKTHVDSVRTSMAVNLMPVLTRIIDLFIKFMNNAENAARVVKVLSFAVKALGVVIGAIALVKFGALLNSALLGMKALTLATIGMTTSLKAMAVASLKAFAFVAVAVAAGFIVQDLLKWLSGGGSVFGDWIENGEKAGGVLGTISKFISGLKSGFLELTREASAFFQAGEDGISPFANRVAPLVSSALSGVQSVGSMALDLLSSLKAPALGLFGAISKHISSMFDLISGEGPAAISKMKGALSSILSSLISGITLVVSTVSASISKFVEKVKGPLSSILDPVTTALKFVFEIGSVVVATIYDVVLSIVGDIVVLITDIVGDIVEAFDVIQEQAGGQFDIEKAKEMLKKGIVVVGEIIKRVASVAAVAIRWAIKTVLIIMTVAYVSYLDFVRDVVPRLKEIWKSVSTFFKSAYAWGVSAWNSVSEFFDDAEKWVDDAVKYVQEQWTKIKEFRTTVNEWLDELGEDAKAWINGVVDWVVSSISGGIQGALNLAVVAGNGVIDLLNVVIGGVIEAIPAKLRGLMGIDGGTFSIDKLEKFSFADDSARALTGDLQTTNNNRALSSSSSFRGGDTNIYMDSGSSPSDVAAAVGRTQNNQDWTKGLVAGFLADDFDEGGF